MAVIACLVAASAACQSHWPPADSELLARLPEPASVGFERRRAVVTIDSDGFSGVFDGICIVRRGPEPAIRLQLLPEIGGVLLDLAASADGFQGTLPQAGIRVVYDADSGRGPRHLLAFLAVSLLEGAADLDPTRVIGASDAEDGGWRVAARSILGPGRVVVRLTSDGTVRGREYKWRGVRWFEERDSAGVHVSGRGFEMWIEEEVSAPVSPRAPELFELSMDGEVQ